MPRDWKYAGSMPGTSEIYINDESDECYYGIARGEEEKIVHMSALYMRIIMRCRMSIQYPLK